MIPDIRNRIPRTSVPDIRNSDPGQDPTALDAISALRTLGFREADARARTRRAWRRLRARGVEAGRAVDVARVVTEALQR